MKLVFLCQTITLLNVWPDFVSLIREKKIKQI
jgi:hypothetical protein